MESNEEEKPPKKRTGIMTYIDKQKAKEAVVYNPDEFDFIAEMTKFMEREEAYSKKPREHVFYVGRERLEKAIDLIDQGREKELSYPFCLDPDWIKKIKNRKRQ